MYVLGIDPSLTSTGIAALSDTSGVATWVVRTAKSDGALGYRLHKIRHEVRNAALSGPELVVVERPFAGQGKAAASATKVLCAAYGAVLLGLHEVVDCPVIEVAPTVRAKYATGKGNANKDDVLAAAIRRFDYQGSNNNEADALIFAWMAAEVLVAQGKIDEHTFSFPQLPSAHYDPIDKWQDWETVL